MRIHTYSLLLTEILKILSVFEINKSDKERNNRVYKEVHYAELLSKLQIACKKINNAQIMHNTRGCKYIVIRKKYRTSVFHEVPNQ